MGGVAGDQGDGAGQLTLGVKVGVDVLLVVIVAGQVIDQHIVDGDDLLLAGGGVADDDGVGVRVVLRQGGRIAGGVDDGQLQLIGQAAVELQIVADAVVHAAVGGQSDDVHLVGQTADDLLRGVGDGVDLGGRQVLLPHAEGQLADGQIRHHHDGDRHENGDGGIEGVSALVGGEQLLPAAFAVILLHDAHLLSSSAAAGPAGR